MNEGRRHFLSGLPLMLPAKGGAKGARPAAPDSLEQRILVALEKLDVFDTHEHILPEAQRTSEPMDFFILSGQYALSDLVSAGLSAEAKARILDPTVAESERWRLFEPYWKCARFTGYGQTLRIAIRDIYGVESVGAGTIGKVNDAIRARNRPGLYRYVLKERAKVRVALVDDHWNAAAVRPDPEFFRLAHKFDRFVFLDHAQQVRDLEKLTDRSITTLAGLCEAMKVNFKQCLAAGMVTVKTTLAYNRTLRFEEVAEADAERDFEGLMRASTGNTDFHSHLTRPFRRLEDYMFHKVVQTADSHNVRFQIHTGLQSGNGNFIANSNPTLVTNLFFLYPRVQFDLFHISYPYQGELSVLVKAFPNVCADFTWAHIVSPTAAQLALHEFLEMIPVNKIFGYGGDYKYPELSYGHLVIARRNIARVLAEKVAARFCDEEEAVQIGKRLLHDNAAEFFMPQSQTLAGVR